jgi:hypothetical protein
VLDEPLKIIGLSLRSLWRAASLLLKRDGHEAALFAARRLDEAAGDAEGRAVWERILETVAELTRLTPAEGERVN